jgi:hypothetical protein
MQISFFGRKNMPTLAGRAPKNSYPELLKLNNTGTGLSSTLTAVQDGTGVNSPLSLSTTQVSITGRTQSDAYSYTVSSLGTASGTSTVTMNLSSASEFTLTISASSTTTFAFTNTLGTNQGQVVYLRIVNGGASGAVLTWPTGTLFAAGTAPTLSASGTDLLGIMYDVTSSAYMVFVIGLALAVV